MRPQGKANLVLSREAPVSVYGVLQVHSAPPALCPHIGWAVAGTDGTAVSIPWVSQPAAPGSLRAELTWKGRPGTAGAITSALAGWHRLRFEVTEEASPGCDAMRYCYTPNLGIFSATTSANGDILVPENKLQSTSQTSAQTAVDNQAKKDWLSQTTCRSGYAMADCKGYKAPKTATTGTTPPTSPGCVRNPGR